MESNRLDTFALLLHEKCEDWGKSLTLITSAVFKITRDALSKTKRNFPHVFCVVLLFTQ